MGLDIDAWYGSSWEPWDSDRFIEASRDELGSQELGHRPTHVHRRGGVSR